MRQTQCFKALTRPVSFMGLPFTYVVILCCVVFGGFIVTLSFAYLIVSAAITYAALRILAVFDPRIIDVVFTSLVKTPPPPSYFKGRGSVYRA